MKSHLNQLVGLALILEAILLFIFSFHLPHGFWSPPVIFITSTLISAFFLVGAQLLNSDSD